MVITDFKGSKKYEPKEVDADNEIIIDIDDPNTSRNQLDAQFDTQNRNVKDEK